MRKSCCLLFILHEFFKKRLTKSCDLIYNYFTIILIYRVGLNMFKSMTAFSRCRKSVEGKDITVEIKSVNNRFFDCTVKISRMYSFLEDKGRLHLGIVPSSWFLICLFIVNIFFYSVIDQNFAAA